MLTISMLPQWELTRSAEAYQHSFQVQAAMSPRAPAITMHIFDGHADKDAKRAVRGDERQKDQAFLGRGEEVGIHCMVMPCKHGRVASMHILFEINESNSVEYGGSAAGVANPGRQEPLGIIDQSDESPASPTLRRHGEKPHVDRSPGIGSGEHRHDDADHTGHPQDCDDYAADARPRRGIERDPVIFGCDFISYEALSSGKPRDAQIQKSSAQFRVLIMSLVTASVAAICIITGRRVLSILGFAAIYFVLLSILIVLLDMLDWIP